MSATDDGACWSLGRLAFRVRRCATTSPPLRLFLSVYVDWEESEWTTIVGAPSIDVPTAQGGRRAQRVDSAAYSMNNRTNSVLYEIIESDERGRPTSRA